MQPKKSKMEDNSHRIYCAIDLKSFYSSVECVARGLDPLTANLVVADVSRTQKTICLAVSPSLKAYGLKGRSRLFEVEQRVNEINNQRLSKIPTHRFSGKSYLDNELKAHPDWQVDYIAATPRMAEYIKVSSAIYAIYLKYIAPEDIHVYSIDEVFFDATDYLKNYKLSAHQLCMKMIRDVLNTTGITATAGIGTNLYLCKVAMDVVAKHIPADKDGVRIAELDEITYRKTLWSHKPITDFWRVGRGIAEKLLPYGIDTMGQIARTSINNESLLYKLFGVNAELLIDHAWGWEPVTMPYIKAYKPETTSISNGQVLQMPYTFDRAMVVAKEMADDLALQLVAKHQVTRQIVINIGYDIESLNGHNYTGKVTMDYYGRKVPQHAHGTINLEHYTSSARLITQAVEQLFSTHVDHALLVRRLNITANNLKRRAEAEKEEAQPVQLDLFADNHAVQVRKQEEDRQLQKEQKLQEASIKIKQRFGKNALLKGLNFAEGATQIERNNQIGGHRA